MTRVERFFAVVSLSLLAGWASTGCATAKPIIKTVHDIAHDACVAAFGETKPGLSLEDIAKAYCATDEQLRPFIDGFLSAKKQALGSHE